MENDELLAMSAMAAVVAAVDSGLPLDLVKLSVDVDLAAGVAMVSGVDAAGKDVVVDVSADDLAAAVQALAPSDDELAEEDEG